MPELMIIYRETNIWRILKTEDKTDIRLTEQTRLTIHDKLKKKDWANIC
jgi:hypothetical protein